MSATDIYNEEKEYCIYKITNLISGKSYIGQTKQFEIRMRQHCSYNGSVISSAINKYGKDNFKFEIIEPNLLIEEANTQESYYIDHYNTLSPNGYNLTTGGENYIVSEETRLKMSIVMTGKKQTEETILKRSGEKCYWYGKFGEDHPTFGFKLSGETHWAFGLFGEEHPSFGRKMSDEQRLSMSGENNPNFGKTGELNPNFGRKHTEEEIFNMSGENHWAYGLSKEENPNYGRKRREEELQKSRKTFLITFPNGHQEIIKNLIQFCKDNNLIYSSMTCVAQGRMKQHKGFKCEHYNV